MILLTDLDIQDLKLIGLMRQFQNIKKKSLLHQKFVKSLLAELDSDHHLVDCSHPYSQQDMGYNYLFTYSGKTLLIIYTSNNVGRHFIRTFYQVGGSNSTTTICIMHARDACS